MSELAHIPGLPDEDTIVSTVSAAMAPHGPAPELTPGLKGHPL